MPLEGLPKVLEVMLDNMLSDSSLSSWFVKGGHDFTQITIRFDTSAMTQNTEDKIMYKKVSKRKIERDSNRAEQWRNKATTNVEIRDIDVNTDGDLIHHINSCNINTMSPNMNYTTQGTQYGSSIELPSIVHSPVHGCNKHNLSDATLVTENKESHGNVDTQDCTELGAVCGNGDMDVKDDEHEISSCISSENSSYDDVADVHCNICQGSCNDKENRWYRCTVCDDFDMCSICYKNKEHLTHYKYIHEFKYPNDCSGGYCDSCGFRFRPHSPTFHVYQCLSCQDYAMCKKCHQEGMHVKHLFNMKSVPASDYLQYLHGDG